MHAPFSTLPPTISNPTASATSSPASAAGPTLSRLPIFPLIEKHGLAPVLASLSPRRAKAAGLLTSGTCGHTGIISSASRNLQRSLASRLPRRLAGFGSTLFTLTWRLKITPLGFPILQQRAYPLRTLDRDFSSWPTPNAIPEGRGGLQSDPQKALERRQQGHQLNLDDAVCLTLGRNSTVAAWATPSARDFKSESATDEFNAKRWGAQPRETAERGSNPWHLAEWLPCTDGKARPVEPGTFPLAHGIPGRVGRLRAYGNAIVPQAAAEFVRAYLGS